MGSRNGKDVPCATCGVVFYRPLNILKINKKHYCSHLCRRNQIKFTCDKCGKIFYRFRCKLNTSKKVYCSRECKKTIKSVPCATCGKVFDRIPSLLNKSKKHYCKGGDCRPRKKKKITCATCGISFFRHLSSLKNTKIHYCSKICRQKRGKVRCNYCNSLLIKLSCMIHQHNFCDRVCMDKYYIGKQHRHWRGGISFEPYGIEFNGHLKQKIRDRDKHTCQICKIEEKHFKKKLAIHHIDYDKENNIDLNLISCCHSCHTRTNHNRRLWRQLLQMYVMERGQ